LGGVFDSYKVNSGVRAQAEADAAAAKKLEAEAKLVEAEAKRDEARAKLTKSQANADVQLLSMIEKLNDMMEAAEAKGNTAAANA
jgi:hypothetical protein